MGAVCFEATVCLLRGLGQPPTLLSHIMRRQCTSDLPPASPAPGSAFPAQPWSRPTAQGSQQWEGLLPGERLGQAALQAWLQQTQGTQTSTALPSSRGEGLPNVFMVWREDKVFEKQ